jgi:Tfp pilus assembly protein PilF
MFSAAYAGLADAHSLLSAYGDIPPLELFPKARAAAARALALDSTSAEAHTSLGFIALFHDRDWTTAERELDRALALDTTAASVRLFRSWLFLITRRPERALQEIRRAQQMEPRSLIINTRVGSMLYYTRQYEAAVAQLRQTIDLDPTYELAHAELAHVYAAQNRPINEVRAEMLKAPTFATRYEGLGLGYALGTSGHTAEATRVRDALLARSRERYVDASSLALVYTGLGDTAHAVDWLEKAVADHAWSVGLLEVEPMWDRLRDDRRFRRLVEQLRLAS